MSALEPTPLPARADSDLLSQFTETTPLFFRSGEQALIAQAADVAERLSLPLRPGLSELLSEKLRKLVAEREDFPLIAGALPFDKEQHPATLLVVRKAQRVRAPFAIADAASLGPLAQTRAYSVRLLPSARDYMHAVEGGLARIAQGELQKVVLSRGLELSLEEPIARKTLLRRLLAQNPAGFGFALDVGCSGEPRLLLGASPELLVQKRGHRVATQPLAGSCARSRDRAQDQASAQALLRSPKDRHEHALVIDAVVEALRPFCTSLELPPEPSLVQTPTLWHLGTAIKGVLRDPECSSLALAQALHPTPAVCGYPAAPALSAIRALESEARGLFAGAVGYSDVHGDGEWAVTLRCAELSERSVRLFAGAGIVTGSHPLQELDETAAKLSTMLRALGAGLAGGSI